VPRTTGAASEPHTTCTVNALTLLYALDVPFDGVCGYDGERVRDNIRTVDVYAAFDAFRRSPPSDVTASCPLG
jgi:hypothetical protein